MAGTLLRTPSPASAPYWGMLQNLNKTVKIELVALLSNSLAYDEDEEKNTPLTEKERKAGIMSLAGCWDDDPEDAARMEATIKECREHDVLRDVNMD